MKLRSMVILAAWVALAFPLSAQAPRDLNKIIPVQRAIVAGRDALKAGDAARAVQILEAEQANGKGNAAFDSLLKEAREAKAKSDPVGEIRAPEILTPAPAKPAKLAPPIPPPPPVEEMAKDVGPAPGFYPEPDTKTEPKPLPVIVTPSVAVPAIVTPPRAEVDPFQQTPSHGKLPSNDLSRAEAAFAAKKYDQAASLYAQAAARGLKINADQREQWVYSRLFNVATEVKAGGVAPERGEALLREVADCRKTGSDRLYDFCDRLSAALRPAIAANTGVPGNAGPAPIIPAGPKTSNFIVKGPIDPARSGEILEVALAVRAAMYQRWGGADANDWATPCEITMHSCGKDYRSATRKPESLQGHATVALRGAEVVTRKLDLCADDPLLLDVTLPNELTQLILMEMYAEQALPKWALIGMAALSETPESVARYRRAVPGLLRDKKLLQLSVLMEQQTFPEAEATTAFFAQSISVVGFLVEKKGAKAFAAFMRETPRRGVAKCLQTHYGFKDVADLQQQWLKSLSAVQ